MSLRSKAPAIFVVASTPNLSAFSSARGWATVGTLICVPARGIAITAYGVLSRGILSGRVPDADSKGDIRVIRMPRYAQGNLQKNLTLVEALAAIGKEKSATPAQLAIA